MLLSRAVWARLGAGARGKIAPVRWTSGHLPQCSNSGWVQAPYAATALLFLPSPPLRPAPMPPLDDLARLRKLRAMVGSDAYGATTTPQAKPEPDEEAPTAAPRSRRRPRSQDRRDVAVQGTSQPSMAPTSYTASLAAATSATPAQPSAPQPPDDYLMLRQRVHQLESELRRRDQRLDSFATPVSGTTTLSKTSRRRGAPSSKTKTNRGRGRGRGHAAVGRGGSPHGDGRRRTPAPMSVESVRSAFDLGDAPNATPAAFLSHHAHHPLHATAPHPHHPPDAALASAQLASTASLLSMRHSDEFNDDATFLSTSILSQTQPERQKLNVASIRSM